MNRMVHGKLCYSNKREEKILDYKNEIKKEMEESLNVKKHLISECLKDINKAVEMLIVAIREDKKIYLCGNGGSASDSQHITCELVGRIRKRDISIPAFSLVSNVSTLTALSNDFGYDSIFSKQLAVYAKRGDILIAISTSGKSLNVIKAVETAKKLNMRIIVMTGKIETELSEMTDVTIMVPSDDTPRIQEAHILIGHIFASILEREFGK